MNNWRSYWMESASEKPFVERRSEKRQQLPNCFVKLEMRGSGPLITCFVWDISESGIRLKLPPDIGELAPVVYIQIGNVRKQAKLVWRKGDQTGLKFLD